MWQSLTPISENDTKDLRKRLGLPVTKDLIYYDVTDKFRKYIVMDYYIKEEYPSGFFLVCITLDNRTQRNIHNLFLSHMQEPHFVSDYKAAEMQIDANLESKYL